MYKLWALLAGYFNKLARKSARGRAICNKYGPSARKTAFDFFNQGYRPSQLPDFGIKRESLYRYYQQWKHRDQEFNWRLLRKLLTTNRASQTKTATLLGVSEGELRRALKDCQSLAQFHKRLGKSPGDGMRELRKEPQKQILLKQLLLTLKEMAKGG